MEALSTHCSDTVRNVAATPFCVYQAMPGRDIALPVTAPKMPLRGAGHSQGDPMRQAGDSQWGGRAFDIVIALVAILVFLPFLLLAALAIKASAPGPILFVQRRVGCDGKLFPCLKFRTMVVNSQEVLDTLLEGSPEARAEWERDQKLRRDPRITPIGAILRKSSLDELPQLFNILVGHMSVVGPRPIVEAEIRRYGLRFNAYCSVRPGLTGLWQVSGRNEVSYEARVRLDAFYALRKSMLYDLAICMRTVPAVLASRGVY
jgi:exopolysaccharide production protein ExoY